MPLSDYQRELCESHDWDFSDLKALFLNCTLKKSPAQSHTRGLIDVSKAIFEANDVSVEVIRPVDHDIAFGVYPDMTEQGWAADAWPEIQEKVMAADLLVLGSPIWLGERSSVCTQVIERLYASSGETNEQGQPRPGCESWAAIPLTRGRRRGIYPALAKGSANIPGR